MPFYISGEKVFGPGVLDMKAGLVLSDFALKTLNELNIRPRKKSRFSSIRPRRPAATKPTRSSRLAKKSDCVLCLEPALPGRRAQSPEKRPSGHPSRGRGKSAHGGTPERGVNAIEELHGPTSQGSDAQIQGYLGQYRPHRRRRKGQCRSRPSLGGLATSAFGIRPRKKKSSPASKRLEPSLRGRKIKFVRGKPDPADGKNQGLGTASARSDKDRRGVWGFARRRKDRRRLGRFHRRGPGHRHLRRARPRRRRHPRRNEHLLLPSLAQRAALLTELLRQL